MRKGIFLMCALLTLGVANLTQAGVGERLREWRASHNGGTPAPQAAGKLTLHYGTDSLQQLDFYPAANGNRSAPLVLFVHGGGWKRGSKDTADGSWKAPHYTGLGYAYA